MKKDEFNKKFRDYAQTLSPKPEESSLIGKIYKSFEDFLGINNCLQIGSYPRFTSITPVHDLDILYILGYWNENNHDSSTILERLNTQIKERYKNPTDYEIKVIPQTHSVTISYSEDNSEIFSVDIVPAYIFSKNDFNEDTYKVPEVIREKRGKNRNEYYRKLIQENNQMGWISSDPRGYIKVASNTDETTKGEFRKTVKIIKKWNNNLDDKDNNLKLKSFHLEQIITNFFQKNNNIEIFDVIFDFFIKLPETLDNPNQIKDRANNDKFIDDYLSDFTEEQKAKIKQARDGFLIKLERLKESDSIEELLEIEFYQRQPIIKPTEEFLFDRETKTFIDREILFKIDGQVEPVEGFSSGWLTETPQLQKGLTQGPGKTRKIRFSIRQGKELTDEYRWKVKNSNTCDQPRGEITLNQTKNNPESTEYSGNHYVECYAIKNNTCIAKSKVPIKIL